MARDSPRKALQMLPIKDSGPSTPGPISVHPVTGHLPGGTVLDTWSQSQGGFMGLVCPALPTGLPGRCEHQVLCLSEPARHSVEDLSAISLRFELKIELFIQQFTQQTLIWHLPWVCVL